MSKKTFVFGENRIVFSGLFNGRALLGAGISFNGDGDDVVLALHVYPLGGFIIIKSKLLGKFYNLIRLKQVTYGRNFGFGLMKGGVFTLSCGLASKDMVSRDLLYIDLAEFLGATKYSEETVEEGVTEIELPEGKYKMDYRCFVSTWKRKLGIPSRLRRISFSTETPIDMGEGSPLYGSTMPYADDQDLIDAKIAFINSIGLERKKRGFKRSKK